MFKIERRTFIYFIIYINNTEKYHYDYKIVEFLKSVIPNFTLEEYQDILMKYNAMQLEHEYYFKNKEDVEKHIDCYFRNKEDAKKCVDYLNNSYGIMLKLLE